MRSVEEGHHARKQLGSRSSIIRWSHAARFQQGVRLAENRPTEKLLDYGCGDGTFLSLMSDKFNACVGADIEPEQVDDCRRRFVTVPNVTFCLVQELNGAEHTRSYGVVTCMETLEHCTDSTVDGVLADLDRLCSRDGTVVISVRASQTYSGSADALYADGTVARMVQQSGLVRLPAAIAATKMRAHGLSSMRWHVRLNRRSEPVARKWRNWQTRRT